LKRSNLIIWIAPNVHCVNCQIKLLMYRLSSGKSMSRAGLKPMQTMQLHWDPPWAQFCCKMWGDSLVWNQYSDRVDAEVMFHIYSFPILFLEVFWGQY